MSKEDSPPPGPGMQSKKQTYNYTTTQTKDKKTKFLREKKKRNINWKAKIRENHDAASFDYLRRDKWPGTRFIRQFSPKD